MRVLVTGSSSHLARALLPVLGNDADIEHITGIDLAPAIWQHSKFHAIRADLSSLNPTQLMADHDALVHLAWVVLRGHLPLARMRHVNLVLSKRWLGAASNLSRIIHVSSASVYGHGLHLGEDAPLTPIEGFCYAEHKQDVESWIGAQLPQAVSLRPHIILGDHAQPLLHQLLHAPVYIRLPDPQPLLQCVHEDDVAQAIRLALKQPVSGSFNLAAPDTFNLRDAIRFHRPHAVGISPRMAAWGLRAIWALTGAGGEPGWVKGANQSLTLDCSRANRLLGWQPAHTARQMIFIR